MNSVDRGNLKRLLNLYVTKDMSILDVGCGIGENISLLESLGYKEVVGTDISREMVSTAREAGHEVYVPDEIPERKYDVLLFSHVIEHIGYPEIIGFFEGFFAKAKSPALVIIVTPVLYDAFFNDVDHIKPYYPDGLMMLFSRNKISRQYSSRFTLSLLDIYYRRAPLIPYNIRIRHSARIIDRIIYQFLARGMSFIKIASFGLVARVTGYAAAFRVT